MTTTRSTRSSRRLRDLTNTSEGNPAAVVKSPPADETAVTTEPSACCSRPPLDLSSSTTDAKTGSSQGDTSPPELPKNINRKRKSKGSPSDDESMKGEEAGIEDKDGSVEIMTDDSIAAVESNDNDNAAQDVDSSACSSDAPRRTMRIRKPSNRYSLESQEGSDEDAYSSMEENEESDSEPECSFEEVAEEEEFETDEEDEWNPKQDPWAKEAALYDSSLEESDSEADDYYSDDDDLLEGHQRKAAGKKRKRRKRRPRRNCPKPRAIRRSIDILPTLSVEEKQVYLANIENEEKEEDVTLLYQFLQCTMWDFDFRYNLMSHQYTGVLAVAGVDSQALSERFDGFEEQEQGLLLNLGEEGVAFRRDICSSIAFVKTKGILLGDDMGLGKTVQGLGAAILRNNIYAIQRI